MLACTCQLCLQPQPTAHQASNDTPLGCALLQATSGHTLTLGSRVPREQCYSPSDLRLGGYISVHGRDFLLHDCDAFTREWWVTAACPA